MKQRLFRVVSKTTLFLTLWMLVLGSALDAQAAELLLKRDVLTRVKTSTLANHTITFVTPTGLDVSATTTIDFVGFTTVTNLVLADVDIYEGTSTGSGLTKCASGTATYTLKEVIGTIGAGTTPTATQFSWATSGTQLRIFNPTGVVTTGQAVSATGSVQAGNCVQIVLGALAGGSNRITNPSSATSTAIIIGGGTDPITDSGRLAVAIVTEDQVTSTATVDPLMDFNVGATTTACAATFTGNGGGISMGIIATSTVKSSGADGIEHICTRVTTNASNGYLVAVLANNSDGFRSTSVSTDVIDTVSPTGSPVSLAAGTEGYGLCFGHVTSTDFGTSNGTASTGTAAFSGPTVATPCPASTATSQVGGVDATLRNILTGSANVNNGYSTIRLKASIATLTPPHNDYAITFTFVAAGSF